MMRGAGNLATTLIRLNLRNRMALIYGYVFPLLFLLAFWAIYRFDSVPLVLHLGKLLTITILGGACFGMPTTFVSERERGIWRRYRLTPMPLAGFVLVMLVTRWLFVFSAALLQIGAAMALGMPMPVNPAMLMLAFTVVTFAFLGLGLLIGMVAPNVPSVQALGQCAFLPMLMLGGIAVPVAGLPDWAQHLAAYFPGKPAVEALQFATTGSRLSDIAADLLSLALFALAGLVSATALFRWDTRQPLAIRNKASWLLLALAFWLGASLPVTPEAKRRSIVVDTADVGISSDYIKPQPKAHGVISVTSRAPAAPSSPPEAGESMPPDTAPMAAAAPAPEAWISVGPTDYATVDFARLPPDTGLIAPIAAVTEEIGDAALSQVDAIERKLVDWQPGRVANPVQRVRNLLYVAAIPDILQMEQVERVLPLIIERRLRSDFTSKELAQLLFWIALHPNDGSDEAMAQMDPLGLPDLAAARVPARTRTMIYAFKLLGRTLDISSTRGP